MKRFFIHTLATLAAIAFAAVYLLRVDILEPVAAACRYVTVKIKDFAVHVVSVLATPTPSGREPAVLLVQAKAFVARIAQRKRPQITASWRMCTST